MSMSEGAATLGAWAGRRGEPDGADFAYVAHLLSKFPESAVAVMSGRSLAFVRQVAALTHHAIERRPAPKLANPPRPPVLQPPPEHYPPSSRDAPMTRVWRQSLPPAAKRIIRRVAEKHGLPYESLVSPSIGYLTKPYYVARQECYALLYDMRRPDGSRRYGLPLIGSWFGGRDHGTIHGGIRRHRERTGVAA